MDKTITAAMFSAMILGAAEVERAEPVVPVPNTPEPGEFAPPSQLPDQLLRMRNLLLYAFGTGQEKPGQLRVPIPTENGMFEVIVVKPGVGQPVRVAKNLD